MDNPNQESSTGISNPAFQLENSNPGNDPRNGTIPERKPSDSYEMETQDPGKMDPPPGNFVAKIILGVRGFVVNLINSNKKVASNLMLLGIFLAYNGYLATAIAYNRRNDLPLEWCDGLGFLIILTGIVYWSLFYYIVLKGVFGETLNNAFVKPVKETLKSLFSRSWLRIAVGLLVLAGVIAFVVIDAWDSPRRLVSFGGAFILLLFLFIISRHPGHVKWRQVISGLLLQFLFGVLVLRWEGGKNVLECLSRKVSAFLAFSDEGSAFVYNFAASGSLSIINSTVPELIGTEMIIPTTFAFTSLSVIFFFSFVVNILYHIGAMLWVVRKLGWLLQNLVGTSAAESMSASANIFLGQTEAPLLIKPFMQDLTKSELHAVMTGGFATIAGTVMAAYISFGVKAESLLSASVMAAPCALALSKLVYPELKESRTTAKQIKHVEIPSEGSALDAAARGAVEAITLSGCILANILAFVSFVALLNSIFAYFGTLVGVPYFTLQWLLGKIFIPVAWLIGVDSDEVENVGVLLGLKIVVNEFVAYSELQRMSCAGMLSSRSRRLAEYALCGFANVSSIGIQLGGLGALAPSRRQDLSKIVVTAMITGTTASLVNACIAGSLMDFADEEVLNCL